MTDPILFPGEKVSAIADALEAAGVPHAFGGAIALGFSAAPRATHDIDINVFLRSGEAAEVGRALRALPFPIDEAIASAEVRDSGQVRLRWDGVPVDLFFTTTTFHEVISRRTRSVPWAGRSLRILSGEDLVLCKALFNRRKDWADIEAVLRTQGRAFDRRYTRESLSAMVGDQDPRTREYDQVVSEVDAWLAEDS